MHDSLLDLVPAALHGRSGGVLYSGRAAFEGRRHLYLLGLNPAGDPVAQAGQTIGGSIATARARQESRWSAYADESWRGKPAGTASLQPRVLHLLATIGLEPREVPASNVVFVRTRREAHLRQEKDSLLRSCWPVHAAVIGGLGVRVVACMGGTAGAWARDMLGAHALVDAWEESNDRRWTSTAHAGPGGVQVLTLAHPSVAAWNSEAANPAPLVAAALARA